MRFYIDSRKRREELLAKRRMRCLLKGMRRRSKKFLSYCFVPDILGANYLETLLKKDTYGGGSHAKELFATNMVDRKIS